MYDEKRVMLSNVIVNQIAWFPYAREREKEKIFTIHQRYYIQDKKSHIFDISV